MRSRYWAVNCDTMSWPTSFFVRGEETGVRKRFAARGGEFWLAWRTLGGYGIWMPLAKRRNLSVAAGLTSPYTTPPV